jgi:hypothetical protein
MRQLNVRFGFDGFDSHAVQSGDRLFRITHSLFREAAVIRSKATTWRDYDASLLARCGNNRARLTIEF